MFAVMGAFLVAALAVPHAFGDDALLFGARLRRGALAAHLHLRRGQRRRRRRAGDRAPGPHRAARARAADRAPGFVDGDRSRPRSGSSRWRSTSPVRTCSACAASASRPATSPSASRLIVIIALGESIVAIGAGLDGRARRRRDRRRACSAGASPARSGGPTSTWSRWSPSAASARPRATTLVRIARDSYSYLHLPMIAGHRAGRARGQEDGRARGRAARDRAGGRPVRRHRALLRRPRRLPAAQRRHAEPPAAGGALLCAGADPARRPRWTRSSRSRCRGRASRRARSPTRPMRFAESRRSACAPPSTRTRVSVHRFVTRAGISRRNVLAWPVPIPSDRPGMRWSPAAPRSAWRSWSGARPTTRELNGMLGQAGRNVEPGDRAACAS